MSIIALDIHGLLGLILGAGGVLMFAIALIPLLPASWKATYLRLLRGTEEGRCRLCDIPTIDGSVYCCEEHEITDQQSRAW